jgi:hypothetical protein
VGIKAKENDMELIERDHRDMTERVIETLDAIMYPGQVDLLADMQQDIPRFPGEGIEYVVYDGEVVYAHWTGDYWKMGDSYDPKAVDGWTRITDKPLVQWVSHTSAEHPILREHKIGVIRALVIGMGLEWPESEYDDRDDNVPIHGIRIPETRVEEFIAKVLLLEPDFMPLDLGTADCPTERMADIMHGRLGVVTTTPEGF